MNLQLALYNIILSGKKIIVRYAVVIDCFTHKGEQRRSQRGGRRWNAAPTMRSRQSANLSFPLRGWRVTHPFDAISNRIDSIAVFCRFQISFSRFAVSLFRTPPAYPPLIHRIPAAFPQHRMGTLKVKGGGCAVDVRWISGG